MKHHYLYIILLYLFVNANTIDEKKENTNYNTEKPTDSIFVWVEASKKKSLSYQKRKAFLDKAHTLSLKETKDSLRSIYYLRISYAYYKLEDDVRFREVTRDAYQLTVQLKDSMGIAKTHRFLGNFYAKKGIRDSAYYSYFKAQKIYELLKENFYSGRMYLSMAIMQSDIKDYTGSEISTIKAISLLKPLNKYEHLYKCYNNLGIVLNELEDYDKALFYHNQALEYIEKLKELKNFKPHTLNNIGVVYEMKKEYKLAISYYQLALKEKSLQQNNTKLYAMLLDNLAYSKLKLGDTLNVKKIFFTSLKIRDSINDLSGLAINKLHLAEYYAYKTDTAKAIQSAKETKQLSINTKNNRDLLASLLLLAELDTKNNYKYTNQYIKLNDSLQKEERAVRNKFARIRFETDAIKDENVRLSQQKKILLLVAGLIGLFGLLLYIITTQRSKNKQLQFEQQQQNTNEEIYNLILSQQYKLDEGRRKEKKRISEELHDGVLGKLFGTRLLLGSLNEKNDVATILKREKYINELQEIEEEVRNVSHELNNKSLFSDIGFIQMIEKLLETQSEITNFNYEVNYDHNIVWKEININLKMNLYRILQETIQNINKYAKATNVNITFNVDKDYLHLIIIDDGIGFNAESKRKGIGLKNIQSRTLKLKGEFTLRTQPDKGTSVLIKVPFKQI
ncbi:MAG: tetratricopeptide repeat protein [Flavobacteriaceae bacterium]|nr:tetratricopeptide repeat protein [Flavobacteriaceae bacterium]